MTLLQARHECAAINAELRSRLARARASESSAAANLAGRHSLRAGLETEYHLFLCEEHQRLADWLPALPRESWVSSAPRGGVWLRSGGLLVPDGACAELATPSVDLARERTGTLCESREWHQDYLCRSMRSLPGIAPESWRIEGFTTHWNFAHSDLGADGSSLLEICWRYCCTALPALIALGELKIGGGMWVRPRPGRIELCGGYIADPRRLGAVLAFAGATLRAITRAPAQQRGLPVVLEPPTLGQPACRKGYATGRQGYGAGFYQHVREHELHALAPHSRAVTVQRVLEACREYAAGELESIAHPEHLRFLDAMIRGDEPLGLELTEAPQGHFDVRARTESASSQPPEQRLPA